MAKSKKIDQKDLKALFDKTKERLQAIGKGTGVWLKKGEVELSRLSKIGRLEIDAVNLGIKRDKLFKNIGKRVVEQNYDNNLHDPALRNLATKARNIIDESKKKKKQISKIGKRFLKNTKKKSKSKK